MWGDRLQRRTERSEKETTHLYTILLEVEPCNMGSLTNS